jgi:hypothetical protein
MFNIWVLMKYKKMIFDSVMSVGQSVNVMLKTPKNIFGTYMQVFAVVQGWANSGPLRVFFVARQDSQIGTFVPLN